MLQKKIQLSFFGVNVEICSDNEDVLKHLGRDFAYFSADSVKPDVWLTVTLAEPPYQQVPEVTASMYLSQSIVYDFDNIRYVDYKSRALSILDYSTNKAWVYSADASFLHEISYLLVLSRVGELLDKKGMHRIHGLGFSVQGKAVICLLPMGGGKTTLALSLLKTGSAKILSDDILLVNKAGIFLPFPLRIGVDKASIGSEIPPGFLREFNRSQYGPKILIDVEYFRSQISSDSKPWIILIGSRRFSSQSSIIPRHKLYALRYLIRDCVVGMGLPQMVEYFFRARPGDLVCKFFIAISRFLVCLKIMLKSKVYTFELGIDKTANARVLDEFLQKSAKQGI